MYSFNPPSFGYGQATSLPQQLPPSSMPYISAYPSQQPQMYFTPPSPMILVNPHSQSTSQTVASVMYSQPPRALDATADGFSSMSAAQQALRQHQAYLASIGGGQPRSARYPAQQQVPLMPFSERSAHSHPYYPEPLQVFQGPPLVAREQEFSDYSMGGSTSAHVSFDELHGLYHLPHSEAFPASSVSGVPSMTVPSQMSSYPTWTASVPSSETSTITSTSFADFVPHSNHSMGMNLYQGTMTLPQGPAANQPQALGDYHQIHARKRQSLEPHIDLDNFPIVATMADPINEAIVETAPKPLPFVECASPLESNTSPTEEREAFPIVFGGDVSISTSSAASVADPADVKLNVNEDSLKASVTRSKKSTALSDKQRLSRRQRNKDSARRCRIRKIERLQELERRVNELVHENEKLAAINSDLQKKLQSQPAC